MKRMHARCIVLVAVLLLGNISVPILAQGPTPRVAPLSPRPPSVCQPPAGETALGSSYAQSLPPLKAVLLVGPIDGDDGQWTNSEKRNMDLAAAELQANGVSVFKFYTPSNNWEQIKAAAQGAQFLLYRGHGVYWSDMPHPTVGGFCLKDRFVSSDDIRSDLHLAPNAIVMLYGCFTAGTAGNDTGAIGSAEAQRRVAQYSPPFLDIGIAGYYADWFGDAFQMFVRYLFQGKTLGQAYESYSDFNTASVERYVHPDHRDKVMWLDKDDWGFTKYNNAFVGLPGQRLADLFRAPEMGLRPNSVGYVATPSYPARTFGLRVESLTADVFTWRASVSPSSAAWLTVQPLTGNSGQTLSVVLTPGGLSSATYQASIRIVCDRTDIQNRDQTVPVTLTVCNRVYSTYLPLAFKLSRR